MYVWVKHIFQTAGDRTESLLVQKVAKQMTKVICHIELHIRNSSTDDSGSAVCFCALKPNVITCASLSFKNMKLYYRSVPVMCYDGQHNKYIVREDLTADVQTKTILNEKTSYINYT